MAVSLRISWLAAAVFALGCGRDDRSSGRTYVEPHVSDGRVTMDQLTIVVDARYLTAMGYGNIWRATVREVAAGSLADPELQLALFGNDDGRLYGGRFRSDRTQERGVTLRLRRVPELPAGLEGFVAKDGSIWSIVGIDP